MFKKFQYARQVGKELLKKGYSAEDLPAASNPIFQEYINFCREYGFGSAETADLFHGYLKDNDATLEKLKNILPFGLKLSLLGQEALGEEFIGKKIEGDLLEHILSLYPENNKSEALDFIETVCKKFPTYQGNDILALILYMWTSDRHNERILVLRVPDLQVVQKRVHETLSERYSKSEVEAFRSALNNLKSSGNWI